jgi:hypothetical protein
MLNIQKLEKPALIFNVDYIVQEETCSQTTEPEQRLREDSDGKRLIIFVHVLHNLFCFSIRIVQGDSELLSGLPCLVIFKPETTK